MTVTNGAAGREPSKAPASANSLSVGSAEVFELNTFGGNDTVRATGEA